MYRPSGDALIVHGGGLTPENTLPLKAVQRMETTIDAWHNQLAPNVVAAGGYTFTIPEKPPVTEADVMEDYGLARGIPRDAFYKEGRSLETIGNALFTKTDIVVPQNWSRLVVVTSRSHLPRMLELYRYVYGRDFEIQGIAAPEKVGPKEKIWEFLGIAMANEVLRGTKRGDDQAIKERLYDLVPGYGNTTLNQLALRSMTGLLKRRTI